MITRIEIDGFKSFHDFAVDLRPFQVFIGPNAVGKSNLFDAITLLSSLAADNTVYEAFRKSRGETGELFTVYPDGTQAREMSFAVEMLIGKTISDRLGKTADVSYTRLRYELKIESRDEGGFERLYVFHEALRAILGDYDRWTEENIKHNRQRWIVRERRSPYISTKENKISIHQDRRQGRKQDTPIGKLERTVLSSVSSAEYPTAYAVRQEMLNWRYLQLDPVKLRAPSNVFSPTELDPDGSNLAAVLYHMSGEDEYALTDVSRDMANLVPGILDIRVEPITGRDEFLIEAKTQDGARFSSRVLSDGTLRLLALVTLKNDPEHHGVLCFEEPENGVHPFRLQQIVELLKSLSTDFENNTDKSPPRQMLVNTHSPTLMAHVRDESLLYVDIQKGHQGFKTWMGPVKHDLIEDDQRHYFTRRQVEQYLETDRLEKKREELRHHRL